MQTLITPNGSLISPHCSLRQSKCLVQGPSLLLLICFDEWKGKESSLWRDKVLSFLEIKSSASLRWRGFQRSILKLWRDSEVDGFGVFAFLSVLVFLAVHRNTLGRSCFTDWKEARAVPEASPADRDGGMTRSPLTGHNSSFFISDHLRRVRVKLYIEAPVGS